MLWAAIFILIVIIDQVSKFIVVNNIEVGQVIKIIDNFFYLTYLENKGAAWGVFQNGRYFFITITLIVSVIIVYLIYKSNNRFLKLSLSFILGGAVGNLIDRVLKGSVTDFFGFYIGSYPFPIFNIADSAGVIGTILLVIYLLFIYKETDKEIRKDKDNIQ